jgi:acylphosphatase
MLTQEHATDRPHNARVVQRFVLRGDLAPSSFLAFVADRAAWLDISGWAKASTGNVVTVVAAGPEAMVGALEMALMLGPLDALVRDIETYDERAPVAPGFFVSTGDSQAASR